MFKHFILKDIEKLLKYKNNNLNWIKDYNKLKENKDKYNALIICKN